MRQRGCIQMSNIPRRRRWAEQIEQKLVDIRTDLRSVRFTSLTVAKMALELYHHRRRRYLALLRRVRRCPECHGTAWVHYYTGTWNSGPCKVCEGTGKL